MNKKILIAAVLLLTAIAAAAAGCGFGAGEDRAKSSLEKIKERGKIRVAVFGDKPPFGYIDAGGRHQGYDVYLARRIAKDLLGDENKIEFVLAEASTRVETLKADKADITLANFTVTPERKEAVDFAAPYMKVALGVVSPAGAQVREISHLRGKKLIVNKGTTADAYFTKRHPEIELLKFDQNTEAFQALKDGRGAALAHDNTLIYAWARENPAFAVGIPTLGDIAAIAPAVKKGNTELKEWLDREIAALSEEGFFRDAFAQTLRPAYGDAVAPEDIVVERGDFQNDPPS